MPLLAQGNMLTKLVVIRYQDSRRHHRGIIALPASRVIVFIFGLQEQPIYVKDCSNKIFTRTR